jgi:hypothetical protein
MTEWEQQQVHNYILARMRSLVVATFKDDLTRIKRQAKLGPVSRWDIQTLNILARARIPGADELLEECKQVGLKKRKRFAEVVRETPRREGESTLSWVRRIWDECEKYDTTHRPAVITEELLERYSQINAKHDRNNLPVVSVDAAKSFKCG